MTNNVKGTFSNRDNDEDHSLDTLQPESTGKQEWTSPKLKDFGSLSFVVKGIAVTPNDGVNNLSI